MALTGFQYFNKSSLPTDEIAIVVRVQRISKYLIDWYVTNVSKVYSRCQNQLLAIIQLL